VIGGRLGDLEARRQAERGSAGSGSTHRTRGEPGERLPKRANARLRERHRDSLTYIRIYNPQPPANQGTNFSTGQKVW
jgi:hypothetical protein